jgi:hypothetical protein
MALHRLHKKEWEASKQGISTKTSPSGFSCNLTCSSLILNRRLACIEAKRGSAALSDHTASKGTSSGIATVITKIVNGKTVSKEVAIASGKTIVKAAKQSVNIKVVSGGTKIKDVQHKMKKSWWQNLE